jgi:hypothetical protein
MINKLNDALGSTQLDYLHPNCDEQFNYFSCTTILRNKNYDALIKITPYNPKPLMPICLEELGMIPLRNLGPFALGNYVALGNLGPFASCKPHIPKELGPFAFNK